MAALTLTAIEGIPMVQQGENVAELVVRALDKMGLELHNGDILTICQKIVSKSEGRVVDLKTIEPSHLARNFAARSDKDPRAVELVLRNTNRIVRNDNGVLIVETGPGWVCANAGMDESNSLVDDRAILLPEDGDASATRIRADVKRLCGADVVVLITDTFGRPWRDGLTEVCISISAARTTSAAANFITRLSPLRMNSHRPRASSCRRRARLPRSSSAATSTSRPKAPPKRLFAPLQPTCSAKLET